MNCDETQTLLPAQMDGELGLAENLALEQHLQTCASCRAELLGQQALRTAIQKQMPYFNAPSSLENRIQAALPSTTVRHNEHWLRWLKNWRWPHIGAVVTSVAALVLSVNLYVATPSTAERLAQDIVASHVRSLMVDHLSDVASSDQHTVKPWFNGKLDFAPIVSDFNAQGFALVGGRLDYLDQRPVAALIYRHQQHLINVYVWPVHQSPALAVKTLSLQGYHLAHWNKEGMTFWVISDLNPKALTALVQLLQQQS